VPALEHKPLCDGYHQCGKIFDERRAHNYERALRRKSIVSNYGQKLSVRTRSIKAWLQLVMSEALIRGGKQ
jgi:hypothetical protein